MIMKDLLWQWIPMFSGTGKHKYATHISRFLQVLHLIYPPQLSQVIEPTGSAIQQGPRQVSWCILVVRAQQPIYIMPQCDYLFLTQSQLWGLRCEFFTIIMGHSMLILIHFWQKYIVVVLNHICTVMAINIQPLAEFNVTVPQLDKHQHAVQLHSGFFNWMFR